MSHVANLESLSKRFKNPEFKRQKSVLKARKPSQGGLFSDSALTMLLLQGNAMLLWIVPFR